MVVLFMVTLKITFIQLFRHLIIHVFYLFIYLILALETCCSFHNLLDWMMPNSPNIFGDDHQDLAHDDVTARVTDPSTFELGLRLSSLSSYRTTYCIFEVGD